MLAGVLGPDGRPAANARVEWLLSPDSAGQLLKVGDRGNWRLLDQFGNQPRKIDNHYAVGSTSSQLVTLTPGGQNIHVARGQTWITLSSPTEGVSHVTAFAPNVPSWDGRKQTASIYWIDGQFSYPAPAVAPVGTRQPLSTTVTRSSDGTPVEGWLVRYEVISDDGAAFAPDGTQAIEVLTDPSGMASVELFQQQAGRGTSQVSIQIIRPKVPSQAGSRRLAVSHGMTTVSWTAAEVALRVIGPQQAEVGRSTTFRIEVSNPGTLPVEGVMVTSRPPRNMTYERSSATVNNSGGVLEWQLGQLAAGAAQTIEVDMRCDTAGATEFCAEVNATNGPSARQCATVEVATAAASSTATTLDVEVVRVSSATNIRVGDEVTYNIKITNRGSVAVSDAEITIAYDVGLVHEGMGPGTQQINTKLGGLGAGEVRDDLDVTFRTTKAGTLCHTVNVVATGGRAPEVRNCITVVATPKNVSPGLDVNSAGPRLRSVGESAIFETVISNTGNVTLTNLRVEMTLEPSLKARSASRGYRRDGDRLIWNVDRLERGSQLIFKIDATCQDVDESACMNVTVMADPTVVVGQEACVTIEEASGSSNNDGNDGGEPSIARLSVELIELGELIPVDGDVSYEIHISNPGDQPDSNVVLTVHIPEGLTPLEVKAGAPAKHTIEGQTIRFEPIQEIRGRESLRPFRIVMRAKQRGDYSVVASVTSTREINPIVRQKTTTVFGN